MSASRKSFVTLTEWAMGRRFGTAGRLAVFLLEILLFVAVGLGLIFASRLLIPDIGERSMLKGGINLALIFGWSLLYAKAQKRCLPGEEGGAEG